MQRQLDLGHDPPDAVRECAPVTVEGNELVVYTESPPLVEAMDADIRQAKSRVWMESYIYVEDAAGKAVADALAERARAGLDVRLIVDGWGSMNLSRAFINRLRAAGVRVHVYHALAEAFRGFSSFLHVLNQRNHRKLLVIDDEIAYFGGMNVVDQSGLSSRADAKRRHLPASAGWRDVHLRLAGPKQQSIAASMDQLWRLVEGGKPPRRVPWNLRRVLSRRGETIQFFESRPAYRSQRPQRVILPLLRQAKQEITLAVAYFVPPRGVRRELIRARRRGVRVRVILPGQSDVLVVQWAARHFYEFLLRHGIEIYERKDRMMHSKVMVVDGQLSLVGSCNLDARSLRLNLEFLGVIRSKALAEQLLIICEQEIADSVRIDHGHLHRRGMFQRWLDRTAWWFRKWL